jgi:type IV secretion system protein TrbL
VTASIFSGLLNSALNGIAGSFAQAANSFLAVLFRLLNSSTSLSLNGASFITEFNAVFMIGLLVALALAMIELGAAALQRNGARVAKVPLNLALMVAGTVASISLIDMLLTISDQVSTGLLQATGFSLSTTGMSAALAVAASQPGTELMLAIFIIIAVICCYFALVVRRVLIVVAAVMAPLALAGATAQVTRSWVRRWTETILALVFSKVILVIVLITGFHLLQGAGATNIVSAMASLIGGIGLLFIAAFSPLMAMKMVSFTGGHFAEAALVGHQAVSAAAAPVKKAADVGTAVATGGTSAAAGAALGMRLPGGGGSRTSAPGGATPSAPSSPASRTPSAPVPASSPAPAAVETVAASAATSSRSSSSGRGATAPSGATPPAATPSSGTSSGGTPSAPLRTGAPSTARVAHAATQPASTPSSAPAAGPVVSGAAGAPVGPAMTPSASKPQTSAVPDSRPGTVDGPAAVAPLAAAGSGPSSATKPASPVELPSAPSRGATGLPSSPTQKQRPSAPAPYEGRVPPLSSGEGL